MKMLYHWMLELLFPRKCILCGKLLEPRETDLCTHCRVQAPIHPQGRKHVEFCDQILLVWYYQNLVRSSLQRYKFSGKRCYASAYGRLLAMELMDAAFDILTWVPVSSKRRRKRGYDQVELLAKAVSKELGIPAQRLLDKCRDNPPQSTLKEPAARRANVLGVYEIHPGTEIEGKRICLLDDIITTGATLSECARVLKTAGAAEVIGAAVASPPDSHGTSQSRNTQEQV